MPENTPTICAAEVILRMLRGRWAPSLLMVIADQGPIHFLAIFRALPGISRKVLTDQLRFLVRAGVIARSTSETQPQVIYALTERGRELKRAVDQFNELAIRWDSL
ncbi:winged helix-turn-helix transcriptional regulator [Burkholderia cepacia]|uniref:Transcriptional regulator n=1 Tax=Burkholderia cepacia GG4 TaxID=1009846 RepID=A0A9W3PCF3_BURCE|nr:helix-turn-helix domain-containing protein [Burkholderia cepacia]AFQ51600.1 transcriptional regulator [Burkholderia cepacia GG4]